MDTTILNSGYRRYVSAILATIMIATLVSCSQKALFQTSTVVPAAEGYVKVKQDKNKNYAIEMRISNLAGIERLQPPKSTYLVWLETETNDIKNIGRITSSNNLKVSFNTVSSFKPVKIFITAEDDERAQYPGDMVVLSTGELWSNKRAGK